ncbi:MAG: hypothetical protein HUJ31_18505 [Pseudomonadales bacterium]|nr:hypothetical protein [Pseudomonadales bacterium]
MTGGIRQIQMLYTPEEDRILFRVNSTDQKEFRFWLTRRFSILLLKVLQDHLERDPDISTQGTPQAREAVKEFKQQQAMSSANFKEKFSEDRQELPLGEEVRVAFKLTYNMKGNDLHLGVQPKDGKGINMVINRDINLSMQRLLLDAAGKGDWKLGRWTPAGGSSDQEDNIVIN